MRGILALALLIGGIFSVFVVETKVFKISDAKQIWRAMQAEVAKEKAGPADAKDLEAAKKFKDKENRYVLFGKYGRTFKVELYNKYWRLNKVRYERDGWVAEEVRGKPLVIAGKTVYQSRRVKIWRGE